jgi:hypothetical protein
MAHPQYCVTFPLLLAALLWSAPFCSGEANEFASARPRDVQLVLTHHEPGGTLGGSGINRVFEFKGSFDDVVASYSAWILQNGGTQESSGVGGGLRFELGNRCVYVAPWAALGDAEPLRARIEPQVIERLDRDTGSYIEWSPSDCSFRG